MSKIFVSRYAFRIHPDGSRETQGSTRWMYVGIDYRMLPTKSTEDGRKLLGNYRGIAVVDGYAVYETLARAGPDDDATRAGPQFSSRALLGAR